MPLDEDRRELSKFRLEKAEQNLKAAKLLFKDSLLSESINRSYYCIFHSARALIAYDKFDSRKHSAIIAYFNKNYIKPGKVEKEYSKIISKAFKIRTDSDYKDFYLVTKDETKEQLENAERFLLKVKEYIKVNI
ncbi:MAG: HEPN domain-containing protein [bacterium]|nr:HEPN domain-containing protein [bacterium]